MNDIDKGEGYIVIYEIAEDVLNKKVHTILLTLSIRVLHVRVNLT